MSITWILVANAGAAYLYANYGPKKGLQKIKEFRHDASREKGQDLVSDHPGHNKSHGNGCGSYISSTDPKQHEARSFACQLAKELEWPHNQQLSAPDPDCVNSVHGPDQ